MTLMPSKASSASASSAIVWRVHPPFRDALGTDTPPLEEWEHSGQAQIVKHGPHRTVYRVQLPTLRLYWKRCRLANFRAWLRELLRPPKARLEFDHALALAARGIATIQPIAWGRPPGWWPRESYLLTQACESAVPLADYLEQTLPTLAPAQQWAVRCRLARALGLYLARLHEAGVCHPDLHPGNLLVQVPDQADLWPRFWLLDLHDVRLGPALRWPASRDNLIMFNRWFSLRASRTDRLRFWLSYRRNRWLGDSARLCETTPIVPEVLPGEREQARELERRTLASNQRLWQSRDRRCWGQNRHFYRLRGRRWVGHAVADLDRDWLAQLLADPDAPFRDPSRPRLKDSPSSTVVELAMPTPTGERWLIYKRFRLTSRWDAWKNLFRRSAALRSWFWGHALRDRGLPTPRPLLVLHRTNRLGLPTEGYLLVEKVESAQDLQQWVRALAQRPAEQRTLLLREAIDAVAQLIRRLHQRGLSHRDLKAANLLHGTAGFCLIDLVGVRHPWRMTDAIRMRDLMRLNASFALSSEIRRTDRLRFLRTYLAWGLHGKRGWKRWWKAIAQATAAKIERNQRRQRPLA